jgi:hypothetical protein
VGTENRKFQREKHRVGCEFRIKGAMHAGIVSDLSARGVFVLCSYSPDQGTPIDLILREPGHGEIHLKGRVARLRRSHRSAAVVLPGGFGVELDSAPEAFFALLVSLGLG